MSLGSQLKRIEARLPPARNGPLVLSMVCDERQEEDVRRQIAEAGYGPEDIRIVNLTVPPGSDRSRPVLPYILHTQPSGRPSSDAIGQATELFKKQIHQMVERTRTEQCATAIILSPVDANL